MLQTPRKVGRTAPQLNYLGSGLRFLAPEDEDPLFVNRAFDRHKSKREGVARLDAQSAELRLLAKSEKNVIALLAKVAELRQSPPPKAQVQKGGLTEEQLEDLKTSLKAIRMFHGSDESAATAPLGAVTLSPRSLSPSPPKQPRPSTTKAVSPRSKLEKKPKPKPKPKTKVSPFPERGQEAVASFAAYLKTNGFRSPRFMATCD